MIGKDSTKLVFTLPKTLYAQLKQEAEEQNRSMANLLVVILTEYFKKKGNSSPILKEGGFSAISQ